MKTYKRICIQSDHIEAEDGDRQDIIRGREYITSEEKDGMVTVFSTFWERFPVDRFAGEILFTP